MKGLAMLVLACLALAAPLRAQVRVEVIPTPAPQAQTMAAILRGAILKSSSFVVARDTRRPRLLVSIATSADSVSCGDHVTWAWTLIFKRAPNANTATGEPVSVGLYFKDSPEMVTELLNDLDKAATALGLRR